MKAFVIDVNVAIVANYASSHADVACVETCIDTLRRIVCGAIIVLNSGGRIMREYRKHLSSKGHPGVGDAFMKWLWEHHAVPSRCEHVAITAIPGHGEDYSEFPRDPALASFDKNDRKYVAVARASRNQPHVLNAVDTDWWQHKHALKRHGVRIRFLCPQHMTQNRSGRCIRGRARQKPSRSAPCCTTPSPPPTARSTPSSTNSTA